MALYKEFHDGTLPLSHLNCDIITLLPNLKEVTHIKQFWPICLLNVSFKIFTKVAVRRFTPIAKKLISLSQITFSPRRNIIEGIVILHETIHELIGKR
jgi:hypothetical protein